MIKRWILVVLGVVGSVATAAMLSRSRPTAERATREPAVAVRPLDQLMPEGGLLYVEARNFSRLLKAWNSSPEKSAWLASDSRTVFSQSRLLLRLERFFRRFENAAGAPPDTEFVTAAAGEESALALYDIGKLQFVYITHLPSSDFLTSALWQSRNQLPRRMAAGVTFYVGTDSTSSQVVAFAIAGDYLVLATREDLMVRTLQLLDKQPEHSISAESWYAAAVAAAPKNAGDLRMVLNMAKIAVESHFRTYWVQQNITEMQDYTAAASDLYCEGAVYREERVLLRKNSATSDVARDDVSSDDRNSAAAVRELASLVPADYGFYQVTTADSDGALEIFEQLILPSQKGATEAEREAPQVVLTAGDVGNESDLETRIDARIGSSKESNSDSSELKKQFDSAQPLALLEVQKTGRATDGALLTVPHLLVVRATRAWDAQGVQQAVRSQLAAVLTVSGLGLRWREASQSGEYMELDGLRPLYIAVRANTLYVSDEPEMLVAALQSVGTGYAMENVSYIAEFNHARERENFYELAGILDLRAGTENQRDEYTPVFFSSNMGSLSQALARLESEKVVERNEGGKLFQTVTYKWVK